MGLLGERVDASTIVVCVLRCSAVSDSLQPHGLQPPDSSVHGILQARRLERVAISRPRDQTCIGAGFFTTEQLGKPREMSIIRAHLSFFRGFGMHGKLLIV